jgi:hypothetical protein
LEKKVVSHPFDERSLARFWSKVGKSAGVDGCWIWKAAIDKETGYGVFGYGTNKNPIKINSHRFSWWITNGHPGKLFVLHRCDNRPCCNPSHLFIGTQADNVQDMVTKGRLACFVGEGNNAAILTDDAVRDIRKLAAMNIRYRVLAEQFNVSIPTICMIVKRKRWSHVI